MNNRYLHSVSFTFDSCIRTAHLPQDPRRNDFFRDVYLELLMKCLGRQ